MDCGCHCRRQAKSANAADPDAGRLGMVNHRQTTRNTEQLVVLSLAIVFALVGFVVHMFWIGAVVLLALLWEDMASELKSSRRSSSMVSDVVTTAVDEARGLTREISDSVADHGRESLGGGIRRHERSHSTKSEHRTARQEARAAGIDGRSGMTKAHLQQALEEGED